MVYQVPASAGHLKKNRFHFELNGETLSLPKTEFMPPDGDDYIDEGAYKSRREFFLGLLDAIDPEVGKKVRAARLSRDQLYAIQDQWTEASNVTVGESEASESS